MVSEYRTKHFFADHGFRSNIRVQKMCITIPWLLQGTEFLMLEPIPLHGFRSTHLPGESTGHRMLSPIDGKKTVSHGISRKHISKHSGRCKRKSRLANLYRFCPGTDP